MLRIVPHTVPRVGRHHEPFPDGFELHLSSPLNETLRTPNPVRQPRQATSRKFVNHKICGDWGDNRAESESRATQQRGICTAKPLLSETLRSKIGLKHREGLAS
jgi:hypothetical protein